MPVPAANWPPRQARPIGRQFASICHPGEAQEGCKRQRQPGAFDEGEEAKASAKTADPPARLPSPRPRASAPHRLRWWARTEEEVNDESPSTRRTSWTPAQAQYRGLPRMKVRKGHHQQCRHRCSKTQPSEAGRQPERLGGSTARTEVMHLSRFKTCSTPAGVTGVIEKAGCRAARCAASAGAPRIPAKRQPAGSSGASRTSTCSQRGGVMGEALGVVKYLLLGRTAAASG